MLPLSQKAFFLEKNGPKKYVKVLEEGGVGVKMTSYVNSKINYLIIKLTAQVI